MRTSAEERNWAGNYAYRAEKIHRPSTVEQVQEIVARAPRVRVLGSLHSFTDIADSSELIMLGALPTDLTVDRAAGTVSFSAGLKYGDLAELLRGEGLALHNLASLPHISVAGAVATATHGSGDMNGNTRPPDFTRLVKRPGSTRHVPQPLARNPRPRRRMSTPPPQGGLPG
jgi:FAD/FMN-containing dehydrogenase